ncbi:glutathione S-transferase C-terminal-like protein [Pilatotrama ljubarskyi]|nr:glutathione S-transferase C-terminal-like protein [Pilatotrama ljubarskyi]
MSQSKPKLTLYGHMGPNPLKVAMVLEELGLEFETVEIDMRQEEHKKPDFLKLNPNGRLPALVDHSNNGFTIWESDAIILYIVEKYDPEHKLSVAGANEKFTLIQWLFFQASGQGPYFGQAFWFMRYHPERIPSAVERYQKEILRVFGVLESVLSKQQWLVGEKLTVADISFVIWNETAVAYAGLDQLDGVDIEKQFPAFHKWHQKLRARPAIAKYIEKQTQAVAQTAAQAK